MHKQSTSMTRLVMIDVIQKGLWEKLPFSAFNDYNLKIRKYKYKFLNQRKIQRRLVYHIQRHHKKCSFMA